MQDYDSKVKNLERHFLLRGNLVSRVIDTAVRRWLWWRSSRAGGFLYPSPSKWTIAKEMQAEFKRNGVEM